ncbi:MAG TPA: biotin carboxylase N-terminal domain-containing protein [Mycobacteriales bacterium]|nr:biotin carboxylase N-terminal domain-containing protein [Mycobacteriales bacterium]
MRKVLIANRAEIAIRVARACRDAGLASVAVYADPDLNAQHVQLADEAYALDGSTPAETYLDIDKLLGIAKRSGADAVHPGYGFLSENGAFATAVLEAGLTWIGPPPAAIDALGDKVKARHIAADVGAPLTPGTPNPVSGVDEVFEFVDTYGLPVAIKAAYGGGGRGLKVARNREEIPELYDSAVREAVAAFGRGECFVERFLDRPRHVETQVIADQHGTVVVVGTRDCSLQRRNQKVVEEAPAPFLSDEQRDRLYSASKAIVGAAGYVGAGTCEFLVAQDGSISFLEVNTRLQVEHPVTEETSGVDLVLAQFAIADGQHIEQDDPTPRGHAIEFRINAEDAGRGFLPAPGTITEWRVPLGPGVRVDSGYVAGDTVPSAFDSLIAKLVVTGASRREAINRARRALDEFEVGGMPTIIPFHRLVLTDPAFVDEPFSVHTRWIETEWTGSVPPYDAGPSAEPGAVERGAVERERITVEVGGRRFEVSLPGGLGSGAAPARRKPPSAHRAATGGGALSGDALTAPMQGTIVKVVAEEGQQVEAGDIVVVLEAMKMEQPLNAHRAGRVVDLSAQIGNVVGAGELLCRIVEE